LANIPPDGSLIAQLGTGDFRSRLRKGRVAIFNDCVFCHFRDRRQGSDTKPAACGGPYAAKRFEVADAYHFLGLENPVAKTPQKVRPTGMQFCAVRRKV
jgi:hypothetical protein